MYRRVLLEGGDDFVEGRPVVGGLDGGPDPLRRPRHVQRQLVPPDPATHLIPHHEVFSTTMQPPYSSTKGHRHVQRQLVPPGPTRPRTSAQLAPPASASARRRE